jgi:hypothetical protein
MIALRVSLSHWEVEGGTRSSGLGSITEGSAVLTKVCARGDLSCSPGFRDLRVVEELPIGYNDV